MIKRKGKPGSKRTSPTVYHLKKKKHISNTINNTSNQNDWSILEDDLLKNYVSENGQNWDIVSQRMGVYNKLPNDCEQRWNFISPVEPVRGQWSKEEDELLLEKINKYGDKKWRFIASQIPGRNSKQCRERWHNHLNPNVKKTPWDQWEDNLLLAEQAKIGNKWSKIALLLPGRSENSVKNRFNSLKLRQQQNERNPNKDDPSFSIPTQVDEVGLSDLHCSPEAYECNDKVGRSDNSTEVSRTDANSQNDREDVTNVTNNYDAYNSIHQSPIQLQQPQSVQLTPQPILQQPHQPLDQNLQHQLSQDNIILSGTALEMKPEILPTFFALQQSFIASPHIPSPHQLVTLSNTQESWTNEMKNNVHSLITQLCHDEIRRKELMDNVKTSPNESKYIEQNIERLCAPTYLNQLGSDLMNSRDITPTDFNNLSRTIISIPTNISPKTWQYTPDSNDIYRQPHGFGVDSPNMSPNNMSPFSTTQHHFPYSIGRNLSPNNEPYFQENITISPSFTPTFSGSNHNLNRFWVQMDSMGNIKDNQQQFDYFQPDLSHSPGNMNENFTKKIGENDNSVLIDKINDFGYNNMDNFKNYNIITTNNYHLNNFVNIDSPYSTSSGQNIHNFRNNDYTDLNITNNNINLNSNSNFIPTNSININQTNNYNINENYYSTENIISNSGPSLLQSNDSLTRKFQRPPNIIIDSNPIPIIPILSKTSSTSDDLLDVSAFSPHNDITPFPTP